MAGSTMTTDLMLVVRRRIIGMMTGLCVTRLADAGPRRIAFVECEMVGVKLKERRLHCRWNIRTGVAADQFQILCRLSPEVGIRSCLGTVLVVARAAADGGIACVNVVTGHVAQGAGHSRRIVTGPAQSLLLATIGVEVALAQAVTVLAGNPIGFVVRRQHGDGRADRQHNRSQSEKYVSETPGHN